MKRWSGGGDRLIESGEEELGVLRFSCFVYGLLLVFFLPPFFCFFFSCFNHFFFFVLEMARGEEHQRETEESDTGRGQSPKIISVKLLFFPFV